MNYEDQIEGSIPTAKYSSHPIEKPLEHYLSLDLPSQKGEELERNHNKKVNPKFSSHKEVNIRDSSISQNLPPNAQGNLIRSTNSSRRYSRERNAESKRNAVKLIGAKLSVVFVGFVIFFLCKSSSKLRGINPAPDEKCLIDHGLEFFQPVNEAIHNPENRGKRTFIQLISSEQIDVAFLTMCLIWIAKWKEGDVLYSLGLFYGIRAFIQGLFTFRFISGTYWQFPGFPSLVVPYGDACDFYYSGHTGFLSLLTLYFWKFGHKWLSVLSAGFCVFMIQVLISYRIHYSIDIIIGFFASVYAFYFVQDNLTEFNYVTRLILTKVFGMKTHQQRRIAKSKGKVGDEYKMMQDDVKK